MPRGERAPNQVSITISTSCPLRDEVDHLAKKDGRSRSNWIERAIRERVLVCLRDQVGDDFRAFKKKKISKDEYDVRLKGIEARLRVVYGDIPWEAKTARLLLGVDLI